MQLVKDRTITHRFNTWLQSTIGSCKDAPTDEINKYLHVSQTEEFKNEPIVNRILKTIG